MTYLHVRSVLRGGVRNGGAAPILNLGVLRLAHNYTIANFVCAGIHPRDFWLSQRLRRALGGPRNEGYP
jgi:hypothetical protein